MFDASQYGWDTIYLTTVRLDGVVEKGWHLSFQVSIFSY